MNPEPELDRFDHEVAWTLGQQLVERCRAAGHPVTIVIHLGEQRVFHAALSGTSADNDSWAMRKTRIVRRFDRSSLEVGQTIAGDDLLQFCAVFGLAPADYAPAGGAVPIRVGGALVGVLAVSGLASEEDHDLAVDALHRCHDEAVARVG